MGENVEVVSVLDILDLDEELVDKRLKVIMNRSHFTSMHLNAVFYLLQYKKLINIREDSDCENQLELNFLIKLLRLVNSENISCVCRILNIVLELNAITLLQNSEHLFQQILCDLAEQISTTSNLNGEKDTDSKIIQVCHQLQLCDSILDTVAKQGLKLSLPFLETPLDNILKANEKIKLYFLLNTAPKMFATIDGYGILDRIWKYIKQGMHVDTSLQVLSCLSSYFLPSADEQGQFSLKSYIITQYEFWNILIKGLMAESENLRKISIYLSKRAIDYLYHAKKNICITKENSTIINWNPKDDKTLKSKWDNFFILFESLEEKQSNIVIPSLQLFELVKDLGPCWLNCAYKIGLKHDNTQVKFKCIEYRIQEDINSPEEAVALLEAINDINIHDHLNILYKFETKLNQLNTLNQILKAISKIKWCPVPLFHLSNLLSAVQVQVPKDTKEISKTVQSILKIPSTNIILRKAIEINFTHFIGNNLETLSWKEYLDIFSCLNLDTYNNDKENPLLLKIKNLHLHNCDKMAFFECISRNNIDVDFILLYLEGHSEDTDAFVKTLENKIIKVSHILSRQYSVKREVFDDFMFLINVLHGTRYKHILENIYVKLEAQVEIFLQYVLSLVYENEIITINEAENISETLSKVTDSDEKLKNTLYQLYKSSIMMLRDNNVNVATLILPIMIVKSFTCHTVLNCYYKIEMLNTTQLLTIININRNDLPGESSGRLINILFENTCKIINMTINQNPKQVSKTDLINFIDKIVDCGGYGCLKWILTIANANLPLLLNDSSPSFDVNQFIHKTWKEIEELKTNSQYSPCMELFIDIITHDELLKTSAYNNIVPFYCDKIIDYGYLKISPLKYLVKKLETKKISLDQGQVINVLTEILLFAPIIRKEQRIQETVELALFENPKYALHIDKNNAHFTFQIEYTSILIISQIEDIKLLKAIIEIIMNKINALKNKQRYHGNSQTHKLLTSGLQHLLLIVMKKHKDLDWDAILSWILSLLVSIPHQPSVRVMLEWFICLYIFFKELQLNETNFRILKLKDLAVTSQFNILYWTAKQKILNDTIQNEEFDFVMDKLLANTMGQMFNIRLNAQYFSKQLYYLNKERKSKYAYMINVIENTFAEGSNDKNFIKLCNDFFANKFSVITHFTPSFIYYFLPKYYDQNNNEKSCVEYKENLKKVDEYIKYEYNDGLLSKYYNSLITNEDVFKLCVDQGTVGNHIENGELSGTIQKKYIPWKNMSDIEVYQDMKKKNTTGELILVASLIDKLPNLGGMARTSEIFGVKTYVVDSVRHLQDKTFQGLSVSAERWVNIEEVRPGEPLKAYLMKMKKHGYAVVAAEQTSSSIKLQTFKFPRKTVLLLGHEKEGVPCDLLPIMDNCVEVPQQGFVRSLNVHVTAAIFVWEYTRQNLLK